MNRPVDILSRRHAALVFTSFQFESHLHFHCSAHIQPPASWDYMALCHRYNNYLDPLLNKAPFSPYEDSIVSQVSLFHAREHYLWYQERYQSDQDLLLCTSSWLNCDCINDICSMSYLVAFCTPNLCQQQQFHSSRWSQYIPHRLALCSYIRRWDQGGSTLPNAYLAGDSDTHRSPPCSYAWLYFLTSKCQAPGERFGFSLCLSLSELCSQGRRSANTVKNRYQALKKYWVPLDPGAHPGSQDTMGSEDEDMGMPAEENRLVVRPDLPDAATTSSQEQQQQQQQEQNSEEAREAGACETHAAVGEDMQEQRVPFTGSRESAAVADGPLSHKFMVLQSRLHKASQLIAKADCDIKVVPCPQDSQDFWQQILCYGISTGMDFVFSLQLTPGDFEESLDKDDCLIDK